MTQEELEVFAKDFRALNAEKKQLEAELAKIKEIVTAYFAEAGIEEKSGNGWRITWHQDKASLSFNKAAFQKAMPDVYEQFLEKKPGARKFLVS